MLYLTPIYMRDKQFGFLIVEKKDKLPPGSTVEDGTGTSEVEMMSNRKQPSKKEDMVVEELKTTLQEMSAARFLQSKDLVDALQGIDDKSEVGAEDILVKIERTRSLMTSCDSTVATLSDKKEEILGAAGSTVSKKKRKLKPILLDLRTEHNLKRQLTFTLANQTAELARSNGKEMEDKDEGDLFDDISIHSS
jgi:hypothetical protein